MKVLYIASNPQREKTLLAEREVTALQRLAVATGNRGVTFTFLPELPFEEIGVFIGNERPDIVHISAHGDAETLVLVDTKGNRVKLSAEAVRALFAQGPPQLVYINACTSHEIAKSLASQTLMAVGTDQDITNFAARQGAVIFYSRLIAGCTIAEAFEASTSVVKVLSSEKVKTLLFPENSVTAKLTKLHLPTRIVAQIVDDEFEPKKGRFFFRIGLTGCAPNTIQVVFSTDDETFITGEDLTDLLCDVVRSTPVASEMWLKDPWGAIHGDFRIYALACNADGSSYCASTTIIDALMAFYKVHYSVDTASKFPPKLQNALQLLKYNDGAKLRPKLGPDDSAKLRTKRT